MCGGEYKKWETPRQLSVVNGEELVARTIRLLRENGITDIAISSNNPIFEKFKVPVLKHDNLYIANGIGNVEGDWFNAFYPTDEPVCYLFGDVFFSPEAIKTIVETKTDDIELFGSGEPFSKDYIKTHEEPMALKVMNQKHLHEAIEKTRELDKEHKFWRKPIVWELFTVIKNAPLQVRMGEYTTDYVVINDYTCDVDFKEDIDKLNKIMGGIEMIKLIAIKDFTLERYGELKNIIRKNGIEEKGRLNEGDTFECERELADYLMGNNSKGEVVVKVIEIIPPVKIEEPKEIPIPNAKENDVVKPLKAIKKSNKKTSKKK